MPVTLPDAGFAVVGYSARLMISFMISLVPP
jgi:hypothetical protein